MAALDFLEGKYSIHKISVLHFMTIFRGDFDNASIVAKCVAF